MADSLSRIEARIRNCRRLYLAADAAGHMGECDWYATEIDRLLADWRVAHELTPGPASTAVPGGASQPTQGGQT